MLSEKDVWRLLGEVKDPEIPVISVVELGIIRAVRVAGDKVTVAMTPTFAGCPALDVMREAIQACLRQAGAGTVEVKLQLDPPWSTDMMTDTARAKLAAFGLAPPPRHGGLIQILFAEEAQCPYCGSSDTTLKNSFGPTLCRAIYFCNHCHQPFEQFKPL